MKQLIHDDTHSVKVHVPDDANWETIKASFLAAAIAFTNSEIEDCDSEICELNAAISEHYEEIEALNERKTAVKKRIETILLQRTLEENDLCLTPDSLRSLTISPEESPSPTVPRPDPKNPGQL